jgi:hypothetical protein
MLKPHLAIVRRLGRGEKGAQRVEDLFELAVVPRLEVCYLACEVTVGESEAPELHKRAYDFDRDLGGAFTLEDVCRHERTMFGEGVGELPNAALIART